jgi:hypothetical protein
MSTGAILKSDYDSFGLYLDELETIAATCINRDEFYFNTMVQNVSQQFQSCYVAFIRILCANASSSDYDVEELINTFASVFVTAKSTFGYRERDALFASIDNPTQSFTGKMAFELQQYSIRDPAIQKKLAEYLGLLSAFLHAISEDIETNERSLYDV